MNGFDLTAPFSKTHSSVRGRIERKITIGPTYWFRNSFKRQRRIL